MHEYANGQKLLLIEVVLSYMAISSAQSS
uniref:Uncharacterized protein n=1 Tax=Arundo donax TaxID=35708 RepID=A0A0A9DGE1_ARUDO